MSRFHYLNVNDGDCSIIQHNTGRVTVFDCCNARLKPDLLEEVAASLKKIQGGNFNQKAYPANPITYMRKHGINSVFRFILSHPEMDHMDGIKDMFGAFSPPNFWDIRNKCEKDFKNTNRWREEDWLFYKQLRVSNVAGTARHTYTAGDYLKYFAVNEDGTPGGDGLSILAPTTALADAAIERDNYNDGSYVVLYRTLDYRILLCGDIRDKSMEHVVTNYRADVANIDLLIAPHHGRDSDRSYDFLKVMNPKLTFFGNANSEHLAYGAWNQRKLPFITNHQADCMIVDMRSDGMALYVTNEAYARQQNPATFLSKVVPDAWFVKYISQAKQAAA